MPSATVVRRRRAAVLAVAAASLTLGVSLGARHDEPAELVSPAPRTAALEQATAAPTPTAPPRTTLPLKEQVGKLVVLRFNGTAVPGYVKDVLRKGWAAGVILFKDNITDPAQLKRMTSELRKASPKVVPIICTDQEGGVIRNLTWAPPANGQANQVAGRDARQAAGALRAEGINVSLAPVADVPSVSDAAMATRAFSRDGAVVASRTKAAVEGWMAGKVAPTAKHFPGLGGTTVNTDRGSTSIPNAPTSSDLAPFKAAISARVPLIMSSHARYPRLDAQRIASQSHPILTTLLREQLHFGGVVITDSIEAAAARATGSTEQIAVRSITAGNDIVLTTGQGSWIRSYRALLRQAKASKGFRAQVEASAARVLALQRSLS